MTTNDNPKSPYQDIINLPHHVSSRRPQMSLRDRAAQFAPFAALTGHEDAVKETARLTDTKICLDENELDLLNRKLQYLEMQPIQPTVEIVYFLPDQKKSGGVYVGIKGRIKKIDRDFHSLELEDGTTISIEDILQVNLEPDQ